MLEKTVNPPLTINVHIISNDTDKEERVTTYNLRKAPNAKKIFVDNMGNRLSERQENQVLALDRKYKSIMDLIIWAMNNGKTLEFTNAIGDDYVVDG